MQTLPAAVTLYSRAGCHLCEEAEAVLVEARRSVSFELTVVDVDSDPALADRYGVRVPVVAVDGVERFEYEVRADELLALLGAEPDGGAAPAEAPATNRKRRFWRR